MSEKSARDVLAESLDKMSAEEAREQVLEFFDAKEIIKQDLAELQQENAKALEQKDAEIKNLTISLNAQVKIADALTAKINEAKKAQQKQQQKTEQDEKAQLQEKESIHKREPSFN